MDCCSIMLVTYNRLELTKRTFDNLFANAKHPFRLIIVDNGSTDGSKEWLKELEKNIPQLSGCVAYEPYFNEINLGIARGRNLGLHLADKHEDRWLATMDNDIEAPEGKGEVPEGKGPQSAIAVVILEGDLQRTWRDLAHSGIRGSTSVVPRAS